MHLLPAPAAHLVERRARIVVPALVEPADRSIRVGHPRELRDVVRQGAESLLALGEGPGRRLPVGDFLRGHADPGDPAGRVFDRDPVLRPAAFDAGRCRRRAGHFEVQPLTRFENRAERVFCLRPHVGHDLARRPADVVLDGPAVDLHHFVGPHPAQVFVEHTEPYWCRLVKRLQLCEPLAGEGLAGAQRLLGPPALRHVDADPRDVRAAVGVAGRPTQRVDPAHLSGRQDDPVLVQSATVDRLIAHPINERGARCACVYGRTAELSDGGTVGSRSNGLAGM